MNKATVFSSGKIIISGEHSVVYGYPAFAQPLPIGLTVKLTTDQVINKKKASQSSQFLKHIRDMCERFSQKKFPYLVVKISSQLPQNAGLGSSAALAHAYICAYMQLCGLRLSEDELFELVFSCEKFAHTNPSGVDPAVIIHQLPLIFTKRHTTFSFLYTPASYFPLSKCMVLNSGSATESTGEMVAHVAKHSQRDQILKQIGDVTQRLLSSLDNDQKPWDSITENQRLLEKLGIVGSKAKKIISDIEALGGHAKICGAGGIKTGSGVILAYHKNKQTLLNLISQKNWQRVY